MHMHLRYDWISDAWPVSPLKLYLANGVTTIRCFGPLLELTPLEREQQIDGMVTAFVDKLKERAVPVCTTLVIDDLIVHKLYDPDGFLKRPENRYLPGSYLERFRQVCEKHQLQFKGGEAFAPLTYLLDKKLLKALKAIAHMLD